MIHPTYEIAVEAHDFLVELFGGAPGMRDEGLLRSALSRAANVEYYDQGDVYRCAAAYAQGIAKAHAFVDGNKRTAMTVALLFLELNDIRLTFNATEMVALGVKAATDGTLEWLAHEFLNAWQIACRDDD